MVEETSKPHAPASMAQETSPPNPDQSLLTTEAIIQTGAPECSESSTKNASSSAKSSDSDDENTLEFADELMEKANKAMENSKFTQATEWFSRALQIRVAHFGKLAHECVQAYYKFGCALLSKVRLEADPLTFMPKKEPQSLQDSNKDGPVKSNLNVESSTVSASSDVDHDMSSNQEQEAGDDVHGENKNEDEESAGEDLGQPDEGKSDLDLAWKMLDLARVIVEKQPGDTMEKVDILSTLARVAFERCEIRTSLNDYLKALSIVERIVEPDSRYIAELNFHICMCLGIDSKAQEAIPYCQKAIAVCKSRMQRLIDEVKNSLGAASTSAVSEGDQDVNQSFDCSLSNNPVTGKQAEIETLSGFLGKLKEKLEDLQLLVSHPTSIPSDILAAEASGGGSHAPSAAASSSRIAVANTNENIGSPTVSTAHTSRTSGVTHLGVVGRGVKHAATTSDTSESSPSKKPAVDSKGDNNAS